MSDTPIYDALLTEFHADLRAGFAAIRAYRAPETTGSVIRRLLEKAMRPETPEAVRLLMGYPEPKPNERLLGMLSDAIDSTAFATWSTEPLTADTLRAARDRDYRVPEPQPIVLSPASYNYACRVLGRPEWSLLTRVDLSDALDIVGGRPVTPKVVTP